MQILLLSCPDQPGLVAAAAACIADHGGNITDADQHADTEHGVFVQRIAFDMTPHELDSFRSSFADVARSKQMNWSLHNDEDRQRVAVLVSGEGHCLVDLLARARLGELRCEIPVVISNHDTFRSITEQLGFEFVHLPVDPLDKAAQQARLLETLRRYEIDLVAMARYMQILPDSLIKAYPQRIINIHHSFLPAFIGAKPYHQAFDRGVKIIGATAHYATAELDQGPIICQDVTHVSHRDDVERLIQRGRDLEQIVFARAIQLHLDHRVLAYANRTVVFD